MHEFSLAEALLQQADTHAPRGAVIRAVTVRIGPLQMVDAEALRLAWDAVTSGTRADGCVLRTQWPSPHRECLECGRRWTGGDLIEPCTCGSTRPRWIDGDALILMSLETEVANDPAVTPLPPDPERHS